MNERILEINGFRIRTLQSDSKRFISMIDFLRYLKQSTANSAQVQSIRLLRTFPKLRECILYHNMIRGGSKVPFVEYDGTMMILQLLSGFRVKSFRLESCKRKALPCFIFR